MTKLSVVSLAALTMVACSHSGSSASSTTTTTSTLSFETPEFTVPPGDSFECFYTDTFTSQELSANSSTGQQGPGGHHIVVYYTDDRQPVGHHPCVDQEMVRWHQIAGSAGQDSTGAEGIIALPPGYAIRVPAGKQIVMQTHYINTSGTTKTVRDKVSVKLIEPKDVISYVNAFVIDDDNFQVDPHAAVTHSSTCVLKRDYDVMLLLGHMHEFGSRYTLERVDTQGKVLQTLYDLPWDPLYTSHPQVHRFEPTAPLHLPAGTRIRQTCSWNNTSTEALSFPREMCIAFAYYFPDDGFAICSLEN